MSLEVVNSVDDVLGFYIVVGVAVISMFAIRIMRSYRGDPKPRMIKLYGHPAFWSSGGGDVDPKEVEWTK